MRVLHIQLDLAMGGIESFLFNVYSSIDRNIIQFDFIEYGFEEREFDNKFIELGAKIYKLPNRKQNPIQSMLELDKLLKREKYSIVHIHKNSLSDISAINICKKNKVPTIIVHSHNTNRDSKIVVMLHKINKYLIKNYNVHQFACSNKAAEWMFGRNSKKVRIISNGIDTEKFRYNYGLRCETRKKLNLKDEFIIGNVGRLTEQKNPIFLIKTFHEVKKIIPNCKLLWVGDGLLKKECIDLINKLGDSDDVIFTGKVSNPEAYYQAMDLFVMPSLYEGFPISSVEAQNSGLACILSENITKEIKLADNISFLPLEIGENEWAKIIINIYEKIKYEDRKNNQELIKNLGFDIKSTTNVLQKFYEDFYKL